MKRIMILGAGIFQLPAIQKAKDMGLEVVAIDMDKNAIGLSEADIGLNINTIDIPNALNAAQQYKIDGVMTIASDMPMRTVAAIAKKMNLVGISDETALKATNKVMMRNALAEYNVPIPIFFSAATKDEFRYAVNKIINLGYKCIVKPADNSGSRGVCLLDTNSKENIDYIYEYSKSFSRNGNVIIEEYMEGSEVSVETLSIKGKCHVIQITDKLTTGAPYFVEMGHSEPSMLPEEIKKQIAQIAVAANKAIGITEGPSHTEIMITKDGPKVVELGARLGGDNITTQLVPLSTGIDMVECCIRIAMGELPDIEPKYNKAAAIRYIKNAVGRIKHIEGLEEAENIQGVKQVRIVHGIGYDAKEIKNSLDRVGFVIAQDTNVENAVRACEHALNKIRINYE